MEGVNIKELIDRIKFLEDENSKLKNQLDVEKKTTRRLNLDAQRWFDMAMDLLHK